MRQQRSLPADVFLQQVNVASAGKNSREINALLSAPLALTDIYLKLGAGRRCSAYELCHTQSYFE